MRNTMQIAMQNNMRIGTGLIVEMKKQKASSSSTCATKPNSASADYPVA